jgi:pimeloyl-ACP methyl ester carboxylesterase
VQNNATLQAEYNNASYAALLDKIGPAIVIAHSQGGPFGWQLADARPQLVKALVALESEGPPFENYESQSSVWADALAYCV